MLYVRKTESCMLIGITGGIGSGKSMVRQFWGTYFSLPSIDVDALCRQILAKGESGWQALQANLGNRFFTDNGNLDRPRLRAALFSDPVFRRQVDSLLHPLARTALQEQVRHLESTALVLLEIPLLYEAGWHGDVDRAVVVYAAKEVRCRRIVARDKVSNEQALSAIDTQMSLADKVLAADHVIDNSGSWFLTCLQIFHLNRLLTNDGDSKG